MKKFIFILGGARSGKSRYAVELAKKISKEVAYIATCTMSDEEMKKRIKLHKNSRPDHWKIIEEGKDIKSIFAKLKDRYEVLIIDCLGLFVSNLLMEDFKDSQIQKILKELVHVVCKAKFTTILVSNEVGCGIVPDNLLARRFRDIVGFVNQMIAERADEVIFMEAGIPIKIKVETENAKA